MIIKKFRKIKAIMYKIDDNKFITPQRIFILLEIFEILYKSIFDLCSKLLMNNFLKSLELNLL